MLPPNEPWTPRPPLLLLEQQLAAYAQWRRFVRERETEHTAPVSREDQLDAQRRLQALRRADEALVARTEQSLREPRRVAVAGPALPRAVLVHRNPWVREVVAATLAGAGVEVLACLEDGADGLGVVVAEQPDLLLLEDALPSLPGMAVLRAVVTLSPATLVTLQVARGDAVGRATDAGAAEAHARTVPPAELARSLARLVSRTAEAALR